MQLLKLVVVAPLANFYALSDIRLKRELIIRDHSTNWLSILPYLSQFALSKRSFEFVKAAFTCEVPALDDLFVIVLLNIHLALSSFVPHVWIII